MGRTLLSFPSQGHGLQGGAAGHRPGGMPPAMPGGPTTITHRPERPGLDEKLVFLSERGPVEGRLLKVTHSRWAALIPDLTSTQTP